MEKFKSLLKDIGVDLKVFGYRKVGFSLVKETQDFYQIINFQKDKYSTPININFFINIGIVSKKVFEYKGLKFHDNLMHNQWEVRIEDLFTNGWMPRLEVDYHSGYTELLNFLEKAIIEVVNKEFEKYSTPSNLIDNLINRIINADVLSYKNIEDAMILIINYCPDKINHLVVAIKTKRTSKNDELFLNELFKELSAR